MSRLEELAAMVEQLVLEQRQIAQAMSNDIGAMSQFFTGPPPNAVLFSGTVKLDVNGQFSFPSWKIAYASIAVRNNSASTTLTVTTDAPQAAAPTAGVGVFTVVPSGFVCRTVVGAQLTLYGAAGATADVTVYERPQPPAEASGLAVATSETGTFANGVITAVDATVGGVLLLAANTSRRLAIVENVHATAPFMVGLTPSIDATHGLQILAAGQTGNFATKQALYGFRTTGVSSSALPTEVV